MAKLMNIHKDGKHLGSILADKIVCDPSDDYLLFTRGNETVAMFPKDNIEIRDGSFDIGVAKSQFAEYQSNRWDD